MYLCLCGCMLSISVVGLACCFGSRVCTVGEPRPIPIPIPIPISISILSVFIIVMNYFSLSALSLSFALIVRQNRCCICSCLVLSPSCGSSVRLLKQACFCLCTNRVHFRFRQIRQARIALVHSIWSPSPHKQRHCLARSASALWPLSRQLCPSCSSHLTIILKNLPSPLSRARRNRVLRTITVLCRSAVHPIYCFSSLKQYFSVER